MDFVVELIDGPAKGTTYTTFVAPPAQLVFARFTPELGWTRVVNSAETWPEEARYKRINAVTVHGATVVRYEHEQ